MFHLDADENVLVIFGIWPRGQALEVLQAKWEMITGKLLKQKFRLLYLPAGTHYTTRHHYEG